MTWSTTQAPPCWQASLGGAIMVVPLYMGIAATPQPDEDEPVPGDMLGTMMIFRSGAMVYAMGAMVHAVMSIVFAHTRCSL